MGGVHHNRIAGLRHLRQAAHVGHKGVIAEGRAAFGQQDAFVAGAFDLGHDVGHFPRGQELTLLDVDRGTGVACGQQHVGLAAQEGGDLQDVGHFGSNRALAFGMHIGQHRHADGLAHRLQRLQPGVDAHAAHAGQRGAVGLVVGRLEHILRACGIAGFFHLACDHLRVVDAFQLAGASNQCQRTVIADGQIGDVYMGHDVTCSRRMDAVSEIIR